MNKKLIAGASFAAVAALALTGCSSGDGGGGDQTAGPVTITYENFIANGPWLTPTTVMTARFAKLSAQIDF